MVVDPSGIIATAAHVIAGATEAIIRWGEGEAAIVDGVLDIDKGLDLALVQVTAGGMSVARLGDSDRLELGQRIVAIGARGTTTRPQSGEVSATGLRVAAAARAASRSPDRLPPIERPPADTVQPPLPSAASSSTGVPTRPGPFIDDPLRSTGVLAESKSGKCETAFSDSGYRVHGRDRRRWCAARYPVLIPDSVRVEVDITQIDGLLKGSVWLGFGAMGDTWYAISLLPFSR